MPFVRSPSVLSYHDDIAALEAKYCWFPVTGSVEVKSRESPNYDSTTEVMTVTLKDVADCDLWSTQIEPTRGRWSPTD
jgi:hypothetical protein